MSKILAIIGLTYKEAVRKKTFLIVGLFCIVLIASSALFPVVGEGSRVKLVEIWLVRGISFFGMIMAIFLCATSIPSEIEDRLIQSVLVKPISKETYLIGKFIGFIVVIAFFIAVIGIVGLVYLHLVDWVTRGESSNISRPVTFIKSAQFLFAQPNKQPEAFLEGNYSPREGLSVILRGEDYNSAIWQFENLDKARTGDPVKLKLVVRISEGQHKISSDVGLSIINPLEKKEMVQRLNLFYERPLIVEFPASYIDSLGRVQITLVRLNPESQLTITPESMVILSRPGSFEWNFLKDILLILLQIILVMGLLMAGSTFLSGGVSILLGIFLYFFGSAMGFFRESLESMEKAMKQIALRLETTGTLPPGMDIMPLWLMQTSKSMSEFIFQVLPDFDKFNGTDLLLTGEAIPQEMISSAIAYTGIYLLVALVIGWIGFRSRDLQ